MPRDLRLVQLPFRPFDFTEDRAALVAHADVWYAFSQRRQGEDRHTRPCTEGGDDILVILVNTFWHLKFLIPYLTD